MEVGGYRIDPVLDGEADLAASDLFFASSGDDPLTVAVGGFLVRGHDRVALVDLGYGPGALGLIETGRLPSSLARLGVRRDDVTDVVFTHLHRDHIGWACVDGLVQFPNAPLRCASADVGHFVAHRHDGDVADVLASCAARIEPFEQGTLPLPGVSLVSAPGHTPGSTVLVFSSPRLRVALLGDVAHTPAQLLEPERNTKFDVDAEQARRTRLALVDELRSSRTAVWCTGGHFPGLRFRRLERAG